MSQVIVDRLQDIENLFTRLQGEEGFELFGEAVEPASDEAIAELEKVLGYAVHPEIAAMWRRGFASMTGTMEHDSFVALGRDFTSPEIALRDLGPLRDIAKQWETQEAPEPGSPTAEFVRLAREGFAISFENPVLASDASGAIYLLNYKDCDARKVGSTLSEHLAAWLGAGAFNQVDDAEGQAALAIAVRSHLPGWAIGAGANVWLETYRDLYFS